MTEEAEGLPAPPGNEDNAATVEGRQVAPPSTGFGQLWRKELSLTFEAALSGEELMEYWKRHLDDLWPERGAVYRTGRRVRSGDLIGIDVVTGPMKLSTGGVILDSGPRGFTVMAPQGHMFSGWTRFHTEDSPQGNRAGVVMELRASDPLYEMGLMFGGHRVEERFWAEMLWNLAERFEQRPKVRLIRRRLDHRRQWRRAGNIRHNASIRTTFRRLRRLVTRSA
jgi:hypothetical protein